MKKVYVLSACLLGGLAVTAQSSLTPRLTEAEAGASKSTAISYKKNAPFWGEDFANGFAGNNPSNAAWTSVNEKGLVSTWEFRGPATTPDNTVGSRGSCGANAGVLTSATSDNGFMIFDSNYWDDENGPCGAGAGSGQEPGPQTTSLTSGAIDLSAQPFVTLFFTTRNRKFTGAQLNIQVSTDGGNTFTTVVDALAAVAVNNATSNSQFKADISDLAGGKADVRLRFQWTGDYYFYSLDDIYMDTPPETDIRLGRTFLDDITTYFEYRELPASQRHLLNIGVEAFNDGATAKDITATVTVTKPATGGTFGVFTKTITLQGKDDSLVYIPTFNPQDTGTYNFAIKIETTTPDFNEADNSTIRPFDLSLTAFSDGNGGKFWAGNSFSAFNLGGVAADGKAPVQVGQDFQVFSATKAEAITTVFPSSAASTFTVGQTVVFELYKYTNPTAIFVDGNTATLDDLELLASVEYEVKAGDVSANAAGAVYVKVPFTSPVDVAEGIYMASVSSFGGTDVYNVATTGTTNPDGSGSIRGNIQAGASEANFTRFSNVSPFVKLHLKDIVGIKSAGTATGFDLGQNIPNPTNGNTTINYSLKSAGLATFQVVDITGKVVVSKVNNLSAGNHSVSINAGDLNAGVYFYSLTVGNEKLTRKMIITE